MATIDDVSYGSIDRAYEQVMRTMPEEQDGPIYMVNLMSYRDKAEYPDGRETDLTGKQADDLYSPFGPFKVVGAEVAFFGDVIVQAFNDEPRWDRVGVIRYPSRKAFLDMLELPEYQELYVHKEAGMAHTEIIACTPMPVPPLPEGYLPVEDCSYPSTATDGPVVVIHALSYKDPARLDDMTTYQNEAGRIGAEYGVRVAGWFGAEGTIVGSGTRWDQVRFNAFPSLAAIMNLAENPERLAVQESHRKAAIDTTYTLVVRPLINRIPEMVGPGSSHQA